MSKRKKYSPEYKQEAIGCVIRMPFRPKSSEPKTDQKGS
jgi:hypothetical protein